MELLASSLKMATRFNLEKLMKTIPQSAEVTAKGYKTILDGSTVLSGETIKLNKEVVETYIKGAKAEMEASYDTMLNKVKIEEEYLISKKDAY